MSDVAEPMIRAVSEMATSPEALHERLANALVRLSTLRPEEFPAEQREVFEAIMDKVTGGGDASKIHASVNAMKDDEFMLGELATEVWEFFIEVMDLHRTREVAAPPATKPKKRR